MAPHATAKSTNVRSQAPAWLRAGMHGLDWVLPPLAAQLAERLMLTPLRHRTPRRERPLLDTARVLTLPWWPRGNTLVGYAWGSGPPILLVHGWAGRATQLGELVAPLVAAGHRVIGFDLPAHGRSDGDRSNVIEFREALLAIGRHHGPFAGVVAHSMGGAAAALAVASGLQTRRLVLIGSPASLREQTQRVGAALGVSAGTVARVTARLEERFSFPLDTIEIEALAPRVEASTLVVHDEGDEEVPFEAGARVARGLPRARLLRTQGLGHRRILRDPATVGAIAEFLTGQSPAAPPPTLEEQLERELYDRDARAALDAVGDRRLAK
jgi:pimeloyl-ACP methyl ester carboxylesterase